MDRVSQNSKSKIQWKQCEWCEQCRFYQNYVNFGTLCTWNLKSDIKIGFSDLKLLFLAIFNHLSQFYHKKLCEDFIKKQNHFFSILDAIFKPLYIWNRKIWLKNRTQRPQIRLYTNFKSSSSKITLCQINCTVFFETLCMIVYVYIKILLK